MARRGLHQFDRVRQMALALRRSWLGFTRGVTFAEDVDLSMSTTFVNRTRGAISIGRSTAIALHCIVSSVRDDGSTAPVRIGSRCFIGAGSLILPGVTIGDGTVVAAGSVVARDLPGDCIASGNPARIVRRGIDAGYLGRMPDAWMNQRLMQVTEALREGKVGRRSATTTPD